LLCSQGLLAENAQRRFSQRPVKPILGAVARHPREVGRIIEGLTIEEDKKHTKNHYWSLWKLFAKEVKRAPWLLQLDHRYPTGHEVLTAILLASNWKEDARTWRSLEGHFHLVDQLFTELPLVPIVLDDYLRFLYYVGELALPHAFSLVADALKSEKSTVAFKDSNTIFLLEDLLQRYVYGRPAELKKEPQLRNSVIFLLDSLVESGSSAAFRMRDDFVTPSA
jgi:hypothetical protein